MSWLTKVRATDRQTNITANKQISAFPQHSSSLPAQDALQELKMAIKASGEHKQKVNMQIAVDGLKIRDEKTGVRT